MHAFLGINAHWICWDWQLNSMLIDFIKLSGPHSGENLADAFLKCIKDFGIQTKVRFDHTFELLFSKCLTVVLHFKFSYVSNYVGIGYNNRQRIQQ